MHLLLSMRLAGLGEAEQPESHRFRVDNEETRPISVLNGTKRMNFMRKSARSWMKRMVSLVSRENWDLQPDVISFNRGISACRGQGAQAVKLLRVLEGLGLQADVPLDGDQMGSCLKASN